MVKSFDLSQIEAKAPLAFFPTMVVVEIVDHAKLERFKPLLERLRHVQYIEGVIVVTDSSPKNDPIATFCKEDALHCVRGKENDPLAWFYAAGVAFDLEVFVRITSHSLKLDQPLVDTALFCFRQNYNKLDYLSNTIQPSVTQGHDLEIFRFNALQEAFFHAEGDNRKGVTTYITKHPKQFHLGSFTAGSPAAMPA
jgi:spore coat polysaccharide biosynthesis protein SpsF (cytidylyltransferase family)